MINVDENTRLYHLNPSYIAHYLEKTGWKRLSSNYENVALFSYELPNEKSIKIILPLNKDAPDIENRISDVIRTLTSFENRDSSEIINSINAIYKDVLYVRIAKGTDLMSLSFNDALTILENVKNLLMYSASGEQEHKRYFSRPLGKGKDFVDNCKFGHTFIGSFGFSIESSISINKKIDDNDSSFRPFSRKVMERIVKSLNEVKEAVLESDIILKNVDDGLNANMCSALIEILNHSKGEVEYSIKWSPEWTVSNEIISKSCISLDQSAVDYLKFASENLLPHEESLKTSIKGKVISLKSEKIGEEVTSDEPDYTVTISGETDNGESVKIHTMLDVEDYKLACTAHRDGITIKVIGDLEKDGRQPWRLINPRDFLVEGKIEKARSKHRYLPFESFISNNQSNS